MTTKEKLEAWADGEPFTEEKLAHYEKLAEQLYRPRELELVKEVRRLQEMGQRRSVRTLNDLSNDDLCAWHDRICEVMRERGMAAE